MLEWKQPENPNGIIDNYKIEITKNCPEYAVSQNFEQSATLTMCTDIFYFLYGKVVSAIARHIT